MFKNIWIRLGSVAGAILAAFLITRYMHVEEAIITTNTLIWILAAAFVGYEIVNWLHQTWTITKVPAPVPVSTKVASIAQAASAQQQKGPTPPSV